MNSQKLLLAMIGLIAAGCSSAIAEQKLFTSLSFGGGSSGGSYELENFYDPSFSFTAELGYMLTPSFGIVPVSFSYHRFDFDSRKYEDNYWDYRDKFKNDNPNRLLNITELTASSSMHGLFVTPGVIFFLPDIYNFRCFLQTGAGLYHAKVTLGETKKIIDSITGEYEQEVRFKSRANSLAVLFGGGVEYRLINIASLTLQFKYNFSFTKSNDLGTSSGGLRFYYLDNGELRSHHFLEEKNTSIMQIASGIRFHF